MIYNFMSLCMAYVGGPGAVVVKSEGKMIQPSWILCTCCMKPIPVDGFFLRNCKQVGLVSGLEEAILSRTNSNEENSHFGKEGDAGWQQRKADATRWLSHRPQSHLTVMCCLLLQGTLQFVIAKPFLAFFTLMLFVMGHYQVGNWSLSDGWVGASSGG